MNTFFFYFLFFLIYSFCGWIMEDIVCGVPAKKFINRGFLIGPYCPIYGIAALTMYLTLGKYADDIPVIFILVFVLGTLLEYFTSYFMEKFFKARWWDYKDKKFNVNGRVCLENSIAFGVLGCILMHVTNPIVVSLLDNLSSTALTVVGSILFSIFVIDSILSYVVLNKLKSTATNVGTKDSTEEETTEKLKEILKGYSILHKRLVNAFPNLKAIIQEAREEIEEIVTEKVLPKLEKIKPVSKKD